MNNAQTKRHFAQALSHPAELHSLRHFDDIYMRGKAMFVIPALWTGLSGDVIHALIVRRVANLTMRCPMCDVCGDLSTGQFAHEEFCMATDENIKRMLGERKIRSKGLRLIDPDPTSPQLQDRVLHAYDDAGNFVQTFVIQRS